MEGVGRHRDQGGVVHLGRRALAHLCVGAVVLAFCVFSAPSLSAAKPIDPPPPVRTDRDTLFVQAGKDKVGTGMGTGSGRGALSPSTAAGPTKQSKYTYVPKGEYAKRVKAYRAEVQGVIDHNAGANAAPTRCLVDGRTLGCYGQNLPLPGPLNIRAAGDPQDPAPVAAAPALTPQQTAYYALARLKLTPPKPMIGPPPSINQWKMAAVGYPLWLWADGNLDPAPVTDSVADIAVGLDARLVKIVYNMGDGHNLTCTNLTRAWTRDVTPGTPSPVCGYAYPKPSLPNGKYTITANAVWAVDWNVNGVTGTIPFYQSATTQLPVGELQVLVH